MRSEAGSLEKFKVVKGQVVEKNIAGRKYDAFFDPMDPIPKLQQHKEAKTPPK